MTQQEFNEAVQSVESQVKRLERSLQENKQALTFVAVDRVIMLGSYCVGRMKSKTYAIRTANALNAYKPNSRGV